MMASPDTPAPLAADPGLADPALRAARIRRLGRLGGLAGLLLGGLWLALAPLDEGVPAAGTVVVDAKRKAVQHASGGVVRAVLVGEGSLVREGQALLRLDDSQARANHEAVLQRYLGLRAQHARLVAERDQLPGLPEPGDLPLPASDARVQLLWTTQRALWQQRRAALDAEIAGLGESQAGQQATWQATQETALSRQQRLASLREELAGLRELVRDGYAPLNRERDLQRQVADAEAALAELRGTAQRSGHAQAELARRISQRRSEFQRDVQAGLAEVYRDMQAEGERLQAARAELDRTELRAPVAGQVVGLSVQNVGAVLQPAQKVADVVPADEALLLEVRIEPTVIDRVQPGQRVDVRFSGFVGSPGLVVDAQVVSVSADVLTDPHSGQSFYLGRAAVTPAGLRQLGGRTLQPGMPVEVLLRTGERSLLAYWLHPLLRRMNAALKEP